MARKLHIGGKQQREGWEIINAVNGPGVDYRGDAADLSRFSDATFAEIYASHVLEHFDYVKELATTLREWHRVLQPGGRLYISVPDLDVLARLFLEKEKYTLEHRFLLMRMMFGGHLDAYDYHKVGLNQEFLTHFLEQAGFVRIQRVKAFGLFDDTSALIFDETPISLNLIAGKPQGQKEDLILSFRI